jgi:concentrative nucleoside transporter, CNT family
MTISLLGIVTLLGIAFAFSENRRGINIRIVGSAFALQFAIAIIVLYVPIGRLALSSASDTVQSIIGHAQNGTEFLFGELSTNTGFVFVLQVLPIIVFISALTAVLYYLNVMQRVVSILGAGLRAIVGTSRVVSLCAVANIFFGQTESPLVVKPYLAKLSREQMFTVMSSGLASISGAILVGYATLGVNLDFLIAAAFMAAPGGILMANILIPIRPGDTSSEEAIANLDIYDKGERPANVIDAAAEGATTGVRLAVNIGAMLLAFIALISLANAAMASFGGLFDVDGLTMESILGWLFAPLMFLLGVPWEDASIAGNFMGQKIILNEFIAYVNLVDVQSELDPRTIAITTFALCGFANFSALAILIGGLASLVPKRRADISKLGLKAVLAGSLSNMMSAAIASVLLF